MRKFTACQTKTRPGLMFEQMCYQEIYNQTLRMNALGLQT
jgi:hypothetical protein